MAVSTASEVMKTRLQVTQYDFDPDNANKNDVAWVDMRDSEAILVGFFRTVGTGALDTFEILGNSESGGGGTDVNIKVHAVASEPNLVGDYVWLECTAAEVNQAGVDAGVADIRYVTASLEFATDSDEGVVTYIRKGKRQFSGLTADSIA